MALPNFHRYSPSKGGWKVPVGQTLKYVQNQGYHTVPTPGYTPPPPPPTLDQRVNTILDKQFATQTGFLEQQKAALLAEAAGRRQNYQDAYKAAALQNATLGTQAQAGWQKAGSAVEGLAGILSGGIGAQTQATANAADQSLANVGLAPTGYDAQTQQGVESYYGGKLPSREMNAMGAISNDYWTKAADSLNRQGLQQGFGAERNTINDINKSYLEQMGAIAAKRPDTYATIRGLFTSEKDSALKAKLANAELAARQLSDAQALKFKYAELAQNATNESDKLKWQTEENKMDREIDRIQANAAAKNAATNDWIAKHPGADKDKKYNTGTYQQKLSSVIQDELQNVEQTFVYSVPTTRLKTPTLPVLSNVDGRQVVKRDRETGVMQPKTTIYTDRVWKNNERLRYREHVFAKLWPMVEGNIAKGNREKAKKYLRGKIWKIAISWDPSLNPDGPTTAALESFFKDNPAAATAATGSQTKIT